MLQPISKQSKTSAIKLNYNNPIYKLKIIKHETGMYITLNSKVSNAMCMLG